MERLESVVVDNSPDEKQDVSSSGHALSSNSFKGSDVLGNESVLYEKFLLDDLDSYWDELNDRLTVSRMVSDSVIKGMVRAVVDVSEERIASKEAEIETLNKMLQRFLCGSGVGSLAEANVDWDGSADIGRLRLAAEEQIQKLNEDVQNVTVSKHETVDSLAITISTLSRKIDEMFQKVKSLVLGQQWEYDFEREIKMIVIKSSVSTLQSEFEKKFYDQRSLINTLNWNWQQKVDELSRMREDLDSMSSSLSSSESGPLLSHGSIESHEEWNGSKRSHFPYATHSEENGHSTKQSNDCENPMLDVADPSHLKHMDRDELVSYYKTEMIKMRRQHDSALQEKTEELFKLKREFLREKGNSLFKKDKEFELLKRKIPEVILKLDGILQENKKFPVDYNDHDELCSLKGRVDGLLSENQQLRYLHSVKVDEVKCLSSQLTDTEARYLQQIKKLEGDVEDMTVESRLQDELHGIISKDLIGKIKCVIDDVLIQAGIVQDVHNIAVRGFIQDGVSTMNVVILKLAAEKSALKRLLYDKDKELFAEIEEKNKLEETLTSLWEVMKEREKDASQTDSALMQQKQQFDMLNEEIDMLKERITKQEVLISNSKMNCDALQSKLEKALRKIHESEMEVKILNEKLSTSTNDLEDARREKTKLHDIIEDREKRLVLFARKENEQETQMKSIVTSLMELSKASLEFEKKLTENIDRNETRLDILSKQWSPFLQHATVLTKKALLYKQMLEIRSSNLQKAEAEVDLLGDEVDALLSLLGKIYIALDHYSPVLQHYPGVMEILKLVRKELEGDAIRSV